MHAMRTAFRAIAAVCVTAAVLCPTDIFAAGGGTGRSTGKGAGTAAKHEKYIVVRVGEPTGSGELQVITQSELVNLKKATEEENKRRKKEYADKKKEAIKNKESTKDLGKPPVARKVTVVSQRYFKTQEEAEEWKEKNPDKADVKKPTAH